VDPNGLNGELLHALLKPGQHLQDFWLQIFPKRLDEAMNFVPKIPNLNIGWGIRIIDGVNWESVTFVAMILLSFSAGIGIVYSAIAHDVGAAFTIAAFLGIWPGLGVTLLQLRPTR
jgi:hypothetical protein